MRAYSERPSYGLHSFSMQLLDVGKDTTALRKAPQERRALSSINQTPGPHEEWLHEEGLHAKERGHISLRKSESALHDL